MLNRKTTTGMLAQITEVNAKRGFVTIESNNNGEALDPMTLTFKNYENLFPVLQSNIDNLLIDVNSEIGDNFLITKSVLIDEFGEIKIEKGFKVSLFMKLEENAEINFSVFTQNLRLLSSKIDSFLKENEAEFKFATLQIEGTGKFVTKDGVNSLFGSINIR